MVAQNPMTCTPLVRMTSDRCSGSRRGSHVDVKPSTSSASRCASATPGPTNAANNSRSSGLRASAKVRTLSSSCSAASPVFVGSFIRPVLEVGSVFPDGAPTEGLHPMDRSAHPVADEIWAGVS